MRRTCCSDQVAQKRGSRRAPKKHIQWHAKNCSSVRRVVLRDAPSESAYVVPTSSVSASVRDPRTASRISTPPPAPSVCHSPLKDHRMQINVAVSCLKNRHQRDRTTLSQHTDEVARWIMDKTPMSVFLYASASLLLLSILQEHTVHGKKSRSQRKKPHPYLLQRKRHKRKKYGGACPSGNNPRQRRLTMRRSPTLSRSFPFASVDGRQTTMPTGKLTFGVPTGPKRYSHRSLLGVSSPHVWPLLVGDHDSYAALVPIEQQRTVETRFARRSPGGRQAPRYHAQMANPPRRLRGAARSKRQSTAGSDRALAQRTHCRGAADNIQTTTPPGQNTSM